jgi:hypothetical protein
MFMNNIHGQRINMDVPERKGSGFVGHHGADFCNFNDRWSQIVNLLSDQDGSVYLIDWYDKQQCHVPAPDKHDRSNGRIFKIAYNGQRGSRTDVASLSDEELVRWHLRTNSWQARHASRVLQERTREKGTLSDGAREKLIELLNPNGDVNGKPFDETARLRALWTLHACGALDDALCTKLLGQQSDYLRAWTIQLMAEDRQISEPHRTELARLAANDPSPVVRLYLAAALQRLPIEQRSEILQRLLAHEEDDGDQNLPLMYWYAAEPVVAHDPAAAVALLEKGKIPVVREYIARRMASSTK